MFLYIYTQRKQTDRLIGGAERSQSESQNVHLRVCTSAARQHFCMRTSFDCSGQRTNRRHENSRSPNGEFRIGVLRTG